MAYATGANLVQYYDRRNVADLCAEGDVVPAVNGVEAHPFVTSALSAASGIVRSAAKIANKYTDDDLDGLASGGDEFLIQLVCRLAMGILHERRSVIQEVPGPIREAQQWVAALRLGEAIFDIPAARDAGLTKIVRPSVEVLNETGFVSAEAAGRFYPTWPEIR